MSRRYEIRDGQAPPHMVEVAGDGTVTVNGEVYRVEPLDGARCLVTRPDGTRMVVSRAGGTAAPWLFAGGRAWALEVAAEGATRRGAGAAAQDMTAPMPATVVSIAAPPGTAVAAGDPVIVLEAMKMELVVKAPRDGVVAAVHCRAGELVQPDTRLAELAP